MLLPRKYFGVLNNSPIKSVIYSGSIHVTPSRTSISDASKSFGWTRSSACTLISYSGWFSANCLATASFSRTFPDKYSSDVSHISVNGFLKITPVSSSVISSSRFPANCAIKGISTFARSPIETASASLAVSTKVTGSGFRIVRFVKISAFRFKLPFSSKSSREDNRQ